jgi:5,10-methylenetetrahydrofolate reductase
MTSVPTVPALAAARLLEDFSLEMTGKDVRKLEEARDTIPRGTRINVTFLDNEDLPMRLAAAKAIRESGFVPVPHISARRLHSEAMLEEFLAALQADGTVENVFVVGGDPPQPHGPYEDSLTSYAARFGVGTSASIARKYGFSLTSLMATAGPDRFIRALARDYDPRRHGEVKLHFYTFGGLRTTSEWIAEFASSR